MGRSKLEQRLQAIARAVAEHGRDDCPWELLRLECMPLLEQEEAAALLAEKAWRAGLNVEFVIRTREAGGKVHDVIYVLFTKR